MKSSPWEGNTDFELPNSEENFKFNVSKAEVERVIDLLKLMTSDHAERGFFILLATMLSLADANDFSNEALIEFLTHEIRTSKKVIR
jgi:hypothetical protein